MFQSGKTTFSKTAKAPAIHTPTNPALTKRQQELHKQVSFTLRFKANKPKTFW